MSPQQVQDLQQSDRVDELLELVEVALADGATRDAERLVDEASELCMNTKFMKRVAVDCIFAWSVLAYRFGEVQLGSVADKCERMRAVLYERSDAGKDYPDSDEAFTMSRRIRAKRYLASPEFASPLNPPPPEWRAMLERQRGLAVTKQDSRTLFYFFGPDSIPKMMPVLIDELGLEEDQFVPVGSVCSGDFVCAMSTGVLFAVEHEDYKWWPIRLSLGELIRRVEAGDESLEEKIYGR